jgi:cell division protein FtsB
MNPPERSKFRGIGRKILFLILFAGLVLTFIFGQRGLLQWDKLRRRVQTMELQNDSLQHEISTLATRIQALENADSLELEQAARRWGMVRPGEEIYIIREDKPDSEKTHAH